MSTENENIITEAAEETQVLAGDLLRQKREELGISQEEIADRLRLRVSVIQSIDENNFEFDQVATFTRGYLRSYAKAVSLDEKLVLNALDGVGDAQHVPQAMQSFSRKTRREKHDRRLMKLTVVIVIAIFGISSIWWYQNKQQDTLDDSPQTEVTETLNVEPPVIEPEIKTEEPQIEEVVESVPSPEPVVESEVNVQQAVVEQPQETTPEVKAEEPVVVAEEVTEPEPSTEPVTTNNTLVMNFAADCWVQVKDAAGKTLVTGVKKAGRNIKVEGQLPYSVVLGAPEAVSMTFASESVDLSGYTSGKVARFTLP